MGTKTKERMSVVIPTNKPVNGPNKKPTILTGKPTKDNLKLGKDEIANAWAPIITKEIDIAIKIEIKAIRFEFHFLNILKPF